MSLASILSLPTTTNVAQSARDRLAAIVAKVKSRRASTGASIRTAHAANAYRTRCARLAERALALHPDLSATLARAACLVGPDAPTKHANETVRRMIDTRATLATLSSADPKTISAALSRLASKGTDPGAPSRLAVTIPEGITLPEWIEAEGGCWYAVPHLAPGRYQYSTRSLAQMAAWSEALETRERETALPTLRPEQSSRLVHNALRITHAREGLDADATEAAQEWDTHNRASDKLTALEDQARAETNPHDARKVWERANGIAKGMHTLRATLKDKAGTLTTARAWVDRASLYLPGEPATRALATSTREGKGGRRVYAHQTTGA